MKTKPSSSTVTLAIDTARIVTLGLLVVLVLLVSTGCKNATRSTVMDPAGIYNLVSVDGQAVPCNLTHEGVAMIVKSGGFTINADGTCRSLSIFAVPPHPDVHREVNASYTLNGTELTMQWEGAGITKGQINGNEFTMTNEGMVFSYRK